jgi:hypothetical protein
MSTPQCYPQLLRRRTTPRSNHPRLIAGTSHALDHRRLPATARPDTLALAPQWTAEVRSDEGSASTRGLNTSPTQLLPER